MSTFRKWMTNGWFLLGLHVLFMVVVAVIGFLAGHGFAVIALEVTWLVVSLVMGSPVITVQERNGSIIKFFGQYIGAPFVFEHFVGVHGTTEGSAGTVILRKDELYIDDLLKYKMDHLSPSQRKNAHEGKPFKYELPNSFGTMVTSDCLYYRRPQTKRSVRRECWVEDPSAATSQIKKSADEIFFDFNGVKRAASVIRTGDPEAEFGDEFLAKMKGRFYFEYNGVPVHIKTSAIIQDEVPDEAVSCKICFRGFGPYHLVGGLFFKGFWPFFSLHEYHLVWMSKKADGKFVTSDEHITHIRLNDDNYFKKLEAVEDRNLVQLDIWIYAKIKIVNPYLSQFRIEKWLENTLHIIAKSYREMVAEEDWEEIMKEKEKYGTSWWLQAQAKICDPKGEDLERRYGIRVLTVQIDTITPLGEVLKVMNAEYMAKKRKNATVVDADAESMAIQKVFDRVKSYGELGIQMEFLKTLRELGRGERSLVLPFGSIESLMRSISVGGTEQDRLAKMLFVNGFTAERLQTILETVKSTTADKEA